MGTAVRWPQSVLPADRWTPDNQRRFLELVADGNPVEFAARFLGLSPQSAYALRRTARGAAFALGWRAAALIARDAIADRLLERALGGQTETVTRPDGSEITRFRYDNRLAATLLRRLDRQVEEATDADTRAARTVAAEFDAFLDIVAQEDGAARAGLFLARRCDPQADARDLQPVLTLAAAAPVPAPAPPYDTGQVTSSPEAPFSRFGSARILAGFQSNSLGRALAAPKSWT